MVDIYCDVDGVLYNINKHALDIASREFGLTLEWELNDDWWWQGKKMTDTPPPREYFEKLLDRKGFFLEGEPIKGAIEGVNKLRDYGFKIKFITSPHWSSDYMMNERTRWLERSFPWFNKSKDLIFTSDKTVCDKENRVLIDDYPHNLNWKDGINICFSQTYNREYQGLRMNGWDELVEYLIGLEKEF